MDNKTQERIKADAEAYVQRTRGQQGRVETYIAGATAENSRAQALVNALEEVAKLASIWPQHGLDPRWVINAIEKKITSALEQWKGKEVEQTEEEKYQQWIKENVTVLGEFDYLVAQKRIYGKKQLRRVYEYLTNPKK